jgi:hypothetical protein
MTAKPGTTEFTFRTFVVCASPRPVADWSELVEPALERNPDATPSVQFPVKAIRRLSWLTRLFDHGLVEAERGRILVIRAAGGRRSRLDLKAAQRNAFTAASLRHARWSEAVNGTATAQGWSHFQNRAKTSNGKLTVETAWDMFLAQPRIAAMMTVSNGLSANDTFDPMDVEAFQAGPVAYATMCQYRALAGDVVITESGLRLEPADDSYAARIAFLKKAATHVAKLPRRCVVVAMTI